MKITVNQLRRIIKEEVRRSLNESDDSFNGVSDDSFNGVDDILETLRNSVAGLEFSKQYGPPPGHSKEEFDRKVAATKAALSQIETELAIAKEKGWGEKEKLAIFNRNMNRPV